MAFGWIGLTNLIGLAGQKAELLVFGGTRILLRSALSLPRRPDPSKESSWFALIERKPARRFLRLSVLVLTECRPGHDAAILRCQPAPPVGRIDVAKLVTP